MNESADVSLLMHVWLQCLIIMLYVELSVKCPLTRLKIEDDTCLDDFYSRASWQFLCISSYGSDDEN